MRYEIVDLFQQLSGLREEISGLRNEVHILHGEVTSCANLIEELIVNPPEDAFDDCEVW